tara:strand:+ start:281 stop:1591 length:1311 start_codon:yes stop_codon:yes gene_type:complete
MAKKIKTFNLNGILKQSGFGTPNHLAPRGSEFTDIDTTNIYTNEYGLTGWKLINFTGTSGTNTYVTGGTYNSITDIITFTNNSGGTFNVSITGLTDTYITGGTYNSNTDIISLNRNDATTVNITGLTDTYITGGTYNSNADIITFTNNSGGAFNISGDTQYFDTSMNFVQDATATTILFKDVTTGNILRAEAINSIQAVANGTDIRIQRTGGEQIFIDALDIITTYIDGVVVTAVLATAVNELNSLFALTTGAIGKLPTITSGDILLTVGNPINYFVTGDNIASVDYDLTGLPAATLTTPLYNQFNLIGGTLLPVGNYTFTVHCFNYWGQTSKVINISVASSYTNTYSYEGITQSYFIKNAVGSENDTPLYRPTGATGPAWTIFSWMKSASTSAWRPIFSFGDYGSAAGGTNAGNVYMLSRINGGNVDLFFLMGTG